MFSNKTLLELIRITDKFEHSEINRIISIFGVPRNPLTKTTVTGKATQIFHYLKINHKTGPFTEDIHIDFLQYLVDDFFRKSPSYEVDVIYNSVGPGTNFGNAFSNCNKELANNLKRDGYIVEEKTIKKLLPKEIEEAKIESELFIELNSFNFNQSKEHLVQAISNHSQGHWASANSQFRTFIESLLIEINTKLSPNNVASNASQAIKFLTEIDPPFFSKSLNEVPTQKDDDSFVYGLWKRLHPDGSHPGPSDEDDCSFRYYLVIVFANYMLRRLKDRQVL